MLTIIQYQPGETIHIPDVPEGKDSLVAFVRKGDHITITPGQLQRLEKMPCDIFRLNHVVESARYSDPRPASFISDFRTDDKLLSQTIAKLSDQFNYFAIKQITGYHRLLVPDGLYDYIFRSSLLSNLSDGTEYELLAGIYRYCMEHTSCYFAGDITYCTDTEYPQHSPKCRDASHLFWYQDFMEHLLFPYIEAVQKGEDIPLYLQKQLIWLLWYRFGANRDNSDKHVIDAHLSIIHKAVEDILNCFSAEAISNPTLPGIFRYYLSHIKSGSQFKVDYHTETSDKKETVYASCCGIPLDNTASLRCSIDCMDYDSVTDRLTIDFSFKNFLDLSAFTVELTLGDEPLPIEETYRYAHQKLFSKSILRHKTYRVTFPVAETIGNQKKQLNCYLRYQGKSYPISFYAKRYCARVSSLIKNTYWHFGDYYIFGHSLPQARATETLIFQKANALRLFFREFAFFWSNFALNDVAIKGLGLRALYRLTHPFFKNKTIWLTYDKLYKGGDCGEYLYRYMLTRQKETGIIPAYVLNRSSADYKHMTKEGLHPLQYKTLKHYLYYLNSSVVFTTHGGVFSFNGLGAPSVPYLQNILHHDVACIQHGLTVQQLAHNSNRLFNNMKRYYCASRREIENLSKPIYGYEDKSILKLTGIPRYDGLINRDQKQILITPTWRNYIAMPQPRKNEARSYYSGFKSTDYFKIYNELLTDPKLRETASKTGYKIIYLLHPVISAQLKDYPKIENVDIVPSLKINYEQILTESSLMVTDYSGVQFDFAYMRKPIVYYHPPALPPHYKEGGFFYDTMGFGEIATEHTQLVELLCEYMENNCQMKPFYRDRADDFFAFSDHNSCQRIYDDMLQFQKSTGKL